RAFGQQAGSEPARMEFRIDDETIRIFDVTAVENAPQVYEVRLMLPPGEKCLYAAYINNYVNQNDPDPNNRDRNLIIEYLELAGPIIPERVEPPESYRRIIFCEPGTGQSAASCARKIVERFATRAFRRPVNERELSRLLAFFDMAHEDGARFDQAIKLALEAVLVSPHFLFRGELQPSPNDPRSVHPVDEYALATRLSYFLWSTMPDEQLFAEAKHGTLRAHLQAQVNRMLRDAKARALVDNFAAQWLQIRSLKAAAPDAWQFPEFDEELRAAMEQETELFCDAIRREDRSVLEFLDADYTFVNQRLAEHYRIPGVRGPEFRRVLLKGTHRGGILTQASILTITSNPTRTSPVKRGKWVLDNILGAPPPSPPADIPPLKEGKELVGTLRQRTEQHRDNPLCASCHARMDPLGFGFENFNAIGEWREKDGTEPVDPSGQLLSGDRFQGPDELREVLRSRRRDQFVRCLSEKLLTYALGRGLEYYDKCAIDQIVESLKKDQYRFSSLIAAVVNSAPFQMRRGEGDRLAARE
ncbi:MAG TPA: DUF1592 domain-containing protein, partial [Bryobacteraceae bacterium]|nr:DUF1592 domain-containing protein [Bryobacteraceae bacterium]